MPPYSYGKKYLLCECGALICFSAFIKKALKTFAAGQNAAHGLHDP